MCLAIPGRIESVDAADPELPMGRVRFGGVLRDVCLAYIPDASVGEWVIVHVGFAISRLDEDEAQRTLDTLRQIAALDDEGPT